MRISDGPTILRHTLRWAFLRALKRKYLQVNGAPQGMQCVVGLVELLGNQEEQRCYTLERSDPAHVAGASKNTVRMRLLDDICV